MQWVFVVCFLIIGAAHIIASVATTLLELRCKQRPRVGVGEAAHVELSSMEDADLTLSNEDELSDASETVRERTV